VLAPLLPAQPVRGRQWRDHRQVIARSAGSGEPAHPAGPARTLMWGVGAALAAPQDRSCA